MEMSYEQMRKIKEIYLSHETVEQKLRQVRKMFPSMSEEYAMDLVTFFKYTVSQLPIIRGVKVETRGFEYCCEYTIITQFPDPILPEVQKTIMRILGGVGEFRYEKWGIGKPTETISRHLKEYCDMHPNIKPILGGQRGYPKVFLFEYDVIETATNECYTVAEVAGFVLD